MAARIATAAAFAAALLIPTAAAAQASRAVGTAVEAPKPTPTTNAPPTATPGGSANDGAGDGRVTFGITTASGGTTDARGFIAFDAPPGAVFHDNVAVINLSSAPLTVDLYAADVGNGSDGTIDVAARTDARQLAGGWVALGQDKVDLPAQSSKTGPGFQVVPVTVRIPKDAEPGDHLAAVLSSVTTQGKPSANAPALNLEQRVGVRVYVTVQGKIRPGLTVTGVRAHFAPGGAFGSGTLEVEYTLTNSGNVRYGVAPSVRATGLFGLAPHGVDGKAIDELLPHASVTQTVTIPGVFPFLIENVTVSAKAVPAGNGASDPAIGTVRASSWTWLWSWLLLVLLVLVAAVVAGLRVRRHRRRTGAWGPPEGLWGQGPPSSAVVGGAGPGPDAGGPPGEPAEGELEHGPSREPVG